MTHAKAQRRKVFVSFSRLCAFAPLRETISFVVVISAAVSSLSAHAQNWDRFRGPNGAGQSDAKNIPTEWKEENFLWRVPLPGLGHSSPVTWENQLFTMSADPETGEQIVLAYDLFTGNKLWEQRFDAGSYSKHGFNSFASSTPAVDEHHLYVMWLTGKVASATGQTTQPRIILAALTHDGKEVWRQDLGSFAEQHGFGKPPIVIDGLVIVANDNELESSIVAYGAITGDKRWEIPRGSETTAFATPCLLDPAAPHKQLLALSTAEGLTSIDPTTGQINWRGFKKDIPLRCVGSPVVTDGLVFIYCGQGGNGKQLLAVRPGDSTHEPEEVYRLQQNIPQVPTPVVAGELLFLLHDRGTVSCHDVATGRQHWRERLGGDFHSSPVRIGDRIFAASRGGEVIVLAADKDYQLLARNVLDEPVHATPAIAHDRLFVRTEQALYCIGEPASAGGP
jgi:outer membrane protein assembly factor BamB